jgi:D-threo-aldose 1-dehydrogenase
MRRRTLRTRTGGQLDLTELGFGGAPIGNLYRPVPEAEAMATLDAAWDVGCRYFDVAPLYGLGLAEHRLGTFLRGHKDGSAMVSTKVGRLLARSTPEARDGQGAFFDVPSRCVVYDYSYDGVMRSLDQSFERLGLDRIDIVLCHDVDVTTHGSKAASDARIREFMDGGYHALADLRASGAVAAIGAGVNDWEVADTLARAGDFDVFLLAGRYTLLEQGALDGFLPLCVERGIGVVVGGPFNSGVLATGSRGDGHYNYGPVPASVQERVERIEAVCQAFGVAMPGAALAFVLAHPAVVSVAPGAAGAEEVRTNAALLEQSIPVDFWTALKDVGAVRQDAPVPGTAKAG